ncbi:hypothetical protein [Geothrix sp. PMB-07]|uniref:hypothetical protein n=1 Tax=Geothrix sp. PMB-07 TaxID=3068640 RepID=UPI0027425DF2|nr:hypothetical protein [Geothrix sp. PMB-07]WLT32763.1 hypothetical protein Q9293_05375 [Geothrix sp. PMB-07]
MKPAVLDQSDFENSLRDWAEAPSIGLAFDVLAGAIALNRFKDARPAAELLLASESASPRSRSLANVILKPDRLSQEPDLQAESDLNQRIARIRIAGIKHALNDYPFNPLLWADLARAYILIGQLGPSIRAMEHAVASAPNNRYVLRSASRLYIHGKDPTRALEILQRSAATKFDPWLLAAQLATSEVAESAPMHVKLAREMLTSASFSTLQLSELSSALGSMEFSAGNQKPGKKYIKLSLESPTENSVAQAIWWARRIKSINVQTDIKSVDRSFEAQARLSYLSANWKESLRSCQNWALDEPFSSRPVTLGSYLACTILEDHRLCEEISNQGLRANPNHAVLLNNKAVALAHQGRIREATTVFRSIPQNHDEAFISTTLLATEGLLHFRSNQPEVGRQLYRKAIEAAGVNRNLKAMALIHLTREELEVGTDVTSTLLPEAIMEADGLPDPVIHALINRLKALPKKPH